MRQRPKGSSYSSKLSSATGGDTGNSEKIGKFSNVAKDTDVFFVIIIYGSWGAYHYQFETLPSPLSLEHVGKRGFSEHEAMQHVVNLTQLGPHPVSSDALERALQDIDCDFSQVWKACHLTDIGTAQKHKKL